MTPPSGEQPDLIVIGGGVAGLYAALCAAADRNVLLLSKGPVFASNSYYAQGGVAAAIGAGDDPFLHAVDTVRAGRGVCRESAVDALTIEAPRRVRRRPRAGGRPLAPPGRPRRRRRDRQGDRADTGGARAGASADRDRRGRARDGALGVGRPLRRRHHRPARDPRPRDADRDRRLRRALGADDESARGGR